jgi:hypothetical protein
MSAADIWGGAAGGMSSAGTSWPIQNSPFGMPSKMPGSGGPGAPGLVPGPIGQMPVQNVSRGFNSGIPQSVIPPNAGLNPFHQDPPMPAGLSGQSLFSPPPQSASQHQQQR